MLGLMEAMVDPWWPEDRNQERVEMGVLKMRLALALQPALVEGWLLGKRPYAEVGNRAAPESCPLHTYLHETLADLPGEGLGVYSTYLTARAHRPIGEWRPVAEVSLPEWAERLVASVDASGSGLYPILATEVLELLHIVHPDEGK